MSDEKKVVDTENVAETLEKEISKKSSKADKPKKSGKDGKKASEFFKGLKGDIKKINWPTFKMVLKSTGVVLFVVILLGVIIFGIDQGMTGIIKLVDKAVSAIAEKVGGAGAAALMLMM